MTVRNNYTERVSRLRRSLALAKVDAVLVSQRENIRYLSGFTGTSAWLLITPAAASIATDSRYFKQAAAEASEFQLLKLTSSSPAALLPAIQEAAVTHLGFEGDTMTYSLFKSCTEALGSSTELTPVGRLVSNLRMTKDSLEITAIRAACNIADRAFENITPRIAAGVTERQLRLDLEQFIQGQCGAEVAFETIVASGPRSALPHGLASSRIMEVGDFVTMDFGAAVDGYCSDITRTVVIGTPTERQTDVYQVVHEAHRLAIAELRSGVSTRHVDTVARGYIASCGFGEYFGHGLGHCIGLAVHDGPGFSPTFDGTLEASMVVTIEPGIYIPDWGGVRLEDDLLITADGADFLTHAPRELLTV